MQRRPAGKSALSQSRHAALPELATLLRRRLRTARLLQARLIHRRHAGGAARSRLTCRCTLLRSAGGRTDLSGRAGARDLARPRRNTRTLRSGRRLPGLLSALLAVGLTGLARPSWPLTCLRR